MGKLTSNRSRLFFQILCFIIFIPTFALSEETYVFERMWPTLQKPWYFQNPKSAVVDSKGYIYMIDDAYTYSFVHKLSSDGQMVGKWGGHGSGDGQFAAPTGIAIDNSDYVYVADNGRIQKFSSDGRFITKWVDLGSESSEDFRPYRLAVDGSGFIYVVDKVANCIRKLTPDGQAPVKWGSTGSDSGQFDRPEDIAIDLQGNIYVAEWNNHRVQKFTSDGQFIAKWGTDGYGEGEFKMLTGIAVDRDGHVITTEWSPQRVQKFTSDGQFISWLWQPSGSRDGEFNALMGVVTDHQNFVYLVDSGGGAIHKYTPSGQFITKWSSAGGNEGEFSRPERIAVDDSGFVYVVDTGNNRIQKFTPDGRFVLQWGGYPMFWSPSGIAVSHDGYVYVSERLNHRIQKFTLDGDFVTKWGSQGSGDGQFEMPWDIAIDSAGDVYVADNHNYRIQKFTPDGQYLMQWGSQGSGEGQFEYYPGSIDIDGNDYVYVNGQKFTTDGQFVAWREEASGSMAFDADNTLYVCTGDIIKQFASDGALVSEFGTPGSNPGSLQSCSDLCIGSENRLYVSEMGGNRIQVFKRISLNYRSKAIIVAGGGPFPGNHLWNATQMSANFAYRALTYQGFTKESIYYLSSDIGLDLDNNGVLDDVDGDTTNGNLQNATANWAADADSLVIYIVDHGGNGTFRMSGAETLSASDLDSWLDQLQQTMPGKVTVIYDACESGSFLSALTPPVGKERTVITSTSPGESAYFVNQGSVSFSNYFWTHIFNGVNVKDAFDLSRNALSTTTSYQHPLLDANGNGASNEAKDFTLAQSFYIGSGTVIYGDSPAIGSVSDPQTINNQNVAPLFAADVTDGDGIARVWAVIRPPDYNQGDSTNPVNDLPSIDLMSVGDNRFEATYEGFNIEGTYQLAIYARDRIGNTSVPVLTTVSVNNPLRRRAIIAIGGSQFDSIWVAMENLGTLAYKSLTFQGYSDDDIYFMSPVTFSAGVDGLTTLSNLDYAVNTWALNNTQDAVIYLIGKGGYGTFKLNATETLSAATLDGWIDNLQNNISSKVTVIYDAPESGSFLPLLTPPADKTRILISSTANDGPAHFLSEGDISFSKFFWRRVLDGMNVRDAFINAKNAISYCNGQTAQLDDNSNGIANEKSDGTVALYYTLGVGIMLAGDDPLVGSVSQEQILSGESSTTIWAQDVTTTGTIDRVWAVISPPTGIQTSPGVSVTDLPTVELLFNAGSNRWESIYNGFATYGTYDIAVYAMDAQDNLSMPSATTVVQTVGSDVYEDDDIFSSAGVITLNAVDAQRHTFHDAGDQDWVMFYGIAGETYEIRTEDTGTTADTVIELYASNGSTLITRRDDFAYKEGELLSWQCPADGIYYVKIRQYDPADYGTNTEYDLRVYHPVGAGAGMLIGQVLDHLGSGIGGAVIKALSINTTAISLPNGYYLMVLPAGTYSITVGVPGYIPLTQENVIVKTENYVSFDLAFDTFEGDINGDNIKDLVDAILALKVLAGMDTAGQIRLDYTTSGTDVNEDGKIGLEEVIYILQRIAGLRQ